MIEVLNRSSGAVLGYRISGKLHDADYKTFVPQIDDSLVEHERLRLLAWLDDFHGWDMQALWDDIKFSTTHCTKMERIAIIGDSKWEELMAKFCKPFTMARIKYFDVNDIESAWAWLEEKS